MEPFVRWICYFFLGFFGCGILVDPAAKRLEDVIATVLFVLIITVIAISDHYMKDNK